MSKTIKIVLSDNDFRCLKEIQTKRQKHENQACGRTIHMTDILKTGLFLQHDIEITENLKLLTKNQYCSLVQERLGKNKNNQE